MSDEDRMDEARTHRAFFEREEKLIQARYPDWRESNRLNRKEATLSERLDLQVTFALQEIALYKASHEGSNSLFALEKLRPRPGACAKVNRPRDPAPSHSGDCLRKTSADRACGTSGTRGQTEAA